MQSPQDLILITGDFNIQGKDMNPLTNKRLIKENAEFASLLKELAVEYCIMTELLSCNQTFTITDLLKKDQKETFDELCTFGDYFVN